MGYYMVEGVDQNTGKARRVEFDAVSGESAAAKAAIVGVKAGRVTQIVEADRISGVGGVPTEAGFVTTGLRVVAVVLYVLAAIFVVMFLAVLGKDSFDRESNLSLVARLAFAISCATCGLILHALAVLVVASERKAK